MNDERNADPDAFSVDEGTGRPAETIAVTRGARRALAELGVETVTEFTPTRGLRVDLAGLSPSGEIWIVEVKSGLEDLRADAKWPLYRAWCDRLYFAVSPRFPQDSAPAEAGLIIADAYGGAVVRDAPHTPRSPARRKASTARLARHAAARLRAIEDPSIG